MVVQDDWAWIERGGHTSATTNAPSKHLYWINWWFILKNKLITHQLINTPLASAIIAPTVSKVWYLFLLLHPHSHYWCHQSLLEISGSCSTISSIVFTKSWRKLVIELGSIWGCKYLWKSHLREGLWLPTLTLVVFFVYARSHLLALPLVWLLGRCKAPGGHFVGSHPFDSDSV